MAALHQRARGRGGAGV